MENVRSPRLLTGKRALEAVASPARLELLSALEDGATTALDLARRLGRSRQSLYYHLRLLEEAGLVLAEPDPEGGRERLFRVSPERLAIAGRRGSLKERDAARKAIAAILRLTTREVSEALEIPEVRSEGPLRELVGFRGKARLTESQLRRLNELFDEMEAVLHSARNGPIELPLYALTVVFTPAREAGSDAPREEEES